ncbi:nucleotidyltransferase family protein [Candidatus Woesearchaeota archaeon]|nr:nucleotidyltransferase family protein [Candidatus Woesearchaeota archaeon]
MKAIILAAGYATRLYPLTKDKAKPLLEVGGKKIIDHILDKIYQIKEAAEIYVVTNDKFYLDFLNWSRDKKDSNLLVLNDGTKANEDRLGAIGDIYRVIKERKIDDHLLVIAGDNLFEFSIRNFVDFFKQKKSSIVALRGLKDKNKVKGKFGVALLKNDRIIDFQEKPEEPKSSLASTACYLFHKEDLGFIKELAESGSDLSGLILKKLVEESELNGFVFTEAWFDIGSFENLEEAKLFYEH